MLYERNELLAARDLLTEAIRQLEAWSLRRPLLVATVVLARVYQALGEPALAHATIERVTTIVQQDDLKQTFSHWASFPGANCAGAGRSIDRRAVGADNRADCLRSALAALEWKHITLAQVYLAQQRLDDAQRLLDRLLPAAQSAGRMGRVLEICLLQAAPRLPRRAAEARGAGYA